MARVQSQKRAPSAASRAPAIAAPPTTSASSGFPGCVLEGSSQPWLRGRRPSIAPGFLPSGLHGRRALRLKRPRRRHCPPAIRLSLRRIPGGQATSPSAPPPRLTRRSFGPSPAERIPPPRAGAAAGLSLGRTPSPRIGTVCAWVCLLHQTVSSVCKGRCESASPLSPQWVDGGETQAQGGEGAGRERSRP